MIKWSKQAQFTGPETAALYAPDMRAVHKALELIKKWNAAEVMDMHVRLNVPEVWRLSDSSPTRAGSRILVEPFIEGFCKCT